MRKNSIISVLSENTGESPIKIGDTVSAMFDAGKEFTVTIKTPRETDPANGIVSYESPLGRSLLNKQAGDAFEYVVGDKTFRGKVVQIHG